MATTILRQFNFKHVSYAPGDESALVAASTAAERSGLEALGFIDDGVTPGAVGGIPSVNVAGIVVGDIQIGAVELKDGETDARAKIGVSTAIAETDLALAVKDPVTGSVEGAAVTTDANGTLQQYLRGLVKLVAAKINVKIADGEHIAIGATDDAAVSTDAAGSVSAKLRGLVKILADVYVSASHWLQVQVQASENFIGVSGGVTTPVSDTFARPHDTTPYAAGDAVAAATTDTGTTVLRSLANVARKNGGTGYLTHFRLWTDQAANVAGFRVHFYKVSAPTTAVVGDNAQMTLKFTNFADRIGQIDLPAMKTSTVATNSTAAHTSDDSQRLFFACAANDRNIYYRIETLSVFTPTDAQNFTLEVAAENN